MVHIGAEGLDDVVEIAVKIEMVRVDIEDDGEGRIVIEDIRLEFARLGDEIFASADEDITANFVEIPADENGGIGVGVDENFGNHAGRRALAVRAGDGDGVYVIAHERTEENAATDDGHTRFSSGDEFFVVVRDGVGVDDEIGTLDIVTALADDDVDAALAEHLGMFIFFAIRTGHVIVLRIEQCRNPRHRDTADADKVDMRVFFLIHFKGKQRDTSSHLSSFNLFYGKEICILSH